MAFAAYLLKKLRELEQFCSSCNGMLAGGTLVAAQQILTRRRADDAGFNIEQERQFPGQAAMISCIKPLNWPIFTRSTAATPHERVSYRGKKS
jgi:hypothetical protein